MSAFDGPFMIGSRVKDEEGYRATVRYIGKVAAAKNKEEIWLGVEWDNQTRGKHDGSCLDDDGKLHRYFQCAFGAGSFVKLFKVSPGITLVQAVRERYVDLNAPTIANTESNLPDAAFVTSKGNQKPIEFVGEHKIRQRQQLAVLDRFSVRSDSVSTIGEGLRELVGHMTEADLQENLLSDWREIANLGLEMPNLQTLLLHGNKMQPVVREVVESISSQSFLSLRVLALNNCNLHSWADLQLLEPLLPSLQELYVAGNVFVDLPRESTEDTQPIVTGFAQLRILDLSQCQLDDWAMVAAFGSLPMLQELVLDGNPLELIAPPVPGAFLQLIRMSLSATALRAWSDIDMLAQYPITLLRLSAVPLFTGKGASEVRPLVVARIPKLTVLNGSRVSERERENAEKAYLVSILREKEAMIKDGKTEEDVMRGLNLFHPQFRVLNERYGADVVPSAQASTTNATMASELVNITFRNLTFGSNGSLEPVAKKLPKSVQISRLKLLVKQLFGLEPRLQQLSLRIYKDSVPTLMDDELATLGYYGAIDGAEIFINEEKA